MATRRSPSKAAHLPIDLARFEWPVSSSATLRHSVLPWFEGFDAVSSIAADPLEAARSFGSRDRLSILGQFAAHQAFLRTADLSDSSFEPAEWGIVRKRGADCRLVRRAARRETRQGDWSPLGTTEACANLLEIGDLSSLKRSWGKPEAIYCELESRLRAAPADLSWFRRSAAGVCRSPGPDTLRSLLSGQLRFASYCDPIAIETVEALDMLETSMRVIVLGRQGTPLRKWSALSALEAWAGPFAGRTEEEVAELIIDALSRDRCLMAVVRAESFDEASKRVVRIASSAGTSSWLVPVSADFVSGSGMEPSRESAFFLATPRLTTLRELQETVCRLPEERRENALFELAASERVSELFDHGTIPDLAESKDTGRVPEPVRSYIAALALLGAEVPVTLARQYLDDLGCQLTLDELSLDPVLTRNNEYFVFPTPAVRNAFLKSVPDSSRQGLLDVAARICEKEGDIPRAIRFSYYAGRVDDSVALAEERFDIAMIAPADRRRWLEQLPAELLRRSTRLASLYVRQLLDAGRYESAVRASESLSEIERTRVAAIAARRRGDYTRALKLLEGAPEDFESAILVAEIHRLEGRAGDAGAALAIAESSATSEREREKISYERGLLALERDDTPDTDLLRERPDSYLAARYAAYAAHASSAYESSVVMSKRAIELAETFPDRIDAELDLLYTRFLSGDWDEARRDARRALSLVEETEGDRAAGGILFTLSFLLADSGSWDEARALADRLGRHYDQLGDLKRLREVDLVFTHLAHMRGWRSEARRIGGRLWRERLSIDMREALAIDLDEIDWIDGSLTDLRSTGKSHCRELIDRHLLNQSRLTGKHQPEIRSSFTKLLHEWELAAFSIGDEARELPPAHTRSEKSRLVHAAEGILRRREIRRVRIAANQLAEELGIRHSPETDIAREGSNELEILRALATADYPFESHLFGDTQWRFATRNRFGQWNQIGSEEAADPLDLERAWESLPADWMRVGENRLLHIDGVSKWSEATREAAGSLFMIRDEHFKQQRLFEQEQTSTPAAPAIDGIVGESPSILELGHKIARVAPSDVAVCILGESGTGKELVARAIHRSSRRRSRGFTAVNCAALPETLIESELFGHVRGAFTGADRDRVGLIESTDEGTLFLDEIGELPLQAQAKLLRFLQEGEFRRVGDSAPRTADVRIVVATNRNLEEQVDSGKFREDLYYRVRGIEIALPPLRERRADVLLLARFFLRRERELHGDGPERFAPEVEQTFLAYRWPGNVRELENMVRAARALAGGGRQIELEHLPDRLRGVLVVRRPSGNYYDELTRFRKDLIERSLLQTQGNQNQAAKALGMSRQALAYQIRELGILIEKA